MWFLLISFCYCSFWYYLLSWLCFLGDSPWPRIWYCKSDFCKVLIVHLLLTWVYISVITCYWDNVLCIASWSHNYYPLIVFVDSNTSVFSLFLWFSLLKSWLIQFILVWSETEGEHFERSCGGVFVADHSCDTWSKWWPTVPSKFRSFLYDFDEFCIKR